MLIFFPKNDVETHPPTFDKIFYFIWIFSYCYLSSPKVVTKH